MKALQRLVPEIVSSDLVADGSGVRAQAVRPDGFLLDDFYFVQAQKMLHVCNAEPRFDSQSAQRGFVARPEFRPPTRFERRGERLGHGVWDLAYVKAR